MTITEACALVVKTSNRVLSHQKEVDLHQGRVYTAQRKLNEAKDKRNAARKQLLEAVRDYQD